MRLLVSRAHPVALYTTRLNILKERRPQLEMPIQDICSTHISVTTIISSTNEEKTVELVLSDSMCER